MSDKKFGNLTSEKIELILDMYRSDIQISEIIELAKVREATIKCVTRKFGVKRTNGINRSALVQNNNKHEFMLDYSELRKFYKNVRLSKENKNVNEYTLAYDELVKACRTNNTISNNFDHINHANQVYEQSLIDANIAIAAENRKRQLNAGGYID